MDGEREAGVCVGGDGEAGVREANSRYNSSHSHASHKLLAKKERGKEGMSERERLSEREKAEQPLHAPLPSPSLMAWRCFVHSANKLAISQRVMLDE